MKKYASIGILLVALVALTAGAALAAKPTKVDSAGNETAWESTTCTKIQDGVLTYSDGHYLYPQALQTGFDAFGYNYQGHLFNGSYANIYLGRAGFPPYEGDDEAYLSQYPDAEYHWAWPYRNVEVAMKWNDAWLANTDCDGDGVLDRPDDDDGTYIGSGAWETNHMSGQYEADSQTCHWTYFVKIIAAPADADLVDGIWYNADGTEIGAVEWGEFAVIQQVENDPCAGIHGLQYASPDHPGFGGW